MLWSENDEKQTIAIAPKSSHLKLMIIRSGNSR